MMVSPKAAQAAGDKFGAKPVCSGPFKFVERVAQDRIVLERYPELLEQGRSPLRPGRLPADPRRDGAPRQPALGPARLHRAHRAVRRAAGSRATAASRSRRSPRSATRASRSTSARATSRRRIRSASDPRVREAFELALDRDGIVQVAMDGEATAGNQWVAPTNTLLREERADAQARRRARQGAAARKPACRTRASR